MSIIPGTLQSMSSSVLRVSNPHYLYPSCDGPVSIEGAAIEDESIINEARETIAGLRV
jgi:hypothetical protein